MKVSVEKSYSGKENEWTVELTQGVQSFRLDYRGPKDEVTWMAKQLSTAIKAHDTERDHNNSIPF